jgi:predicted nucleic acid-binding protein
VKTYVDSSALVPIYVPEAFSPRARHEVRAARQVPFTPLHSLEIRNAFHLLCGRGNISTAELRSVLGWLEDDLAAHRLARLPVDFARLFARADQLVAAHASRLLCRSLDILHVACALQLECTRFVTADDRQLALAKVVGMTTADIKRSARQ